MHALVPVLSVFLCGFAVGVFATEGTMVATMGGPPSVALTREAILKLAAAPAKVSKLDVPEWEGHVFIREMTALERDRFERSLAKERSNGQANGHAGKMSGTARLVALCVVDEEGNRLFRTPSDADTLAEMPVMGMQRCLREIMKVNGFEEGDAEELDADFANGPDSSSLTP